MQKDIEDYLTNLTNLLNGQLRGTINRKAREENYDLIRMTLNDVFEKGEQYGIRVTTDNFAIENLKNQLNNGEQESGRTES